MIILRMHPTEAAELQSAIEGHIKSEIEHTHPNDREGRRDLKCLEALAFRLLEERMLVTKNKEADPCS